MASKHYLIRTAVLCLLLLATAAGVNISVDPYGIFGAPRIEGFNALKPHAGDRGRTTKLHQVLRFQPAGLVVGNSRPEMGLDPENACWPASFRPVYNLGLPGLGVFDQVRYAQHALAGGTVRVVLFGVDFLDFLHRGEASGPPALWPPAGRSGTGFVVDLQGEATGDFAWRRAKDHLSAAFSLGALTHSLMTVALQGGGGSATRTAAGFNPAEDYYLSIVRAEGVGVLFRQKNIEVAKRLSAPGQWVFQDGTRWSSDFQAVLEFLRYSRRLDVEVILFVNPYHAEYLAGIHLAGLWPLFEDWKTGLAELARRENVPLWDFSGFHAYASQNIGQLADKGEALDWFWEPAHYRQELGDLMLANIWRAACDVAAEAPRFGTRIDQVDLEAYFARQRMERDRYLENQSDVVTRLREFYEPSSR